LELDDTGTATPRTVAIGPALGGQLFVTTA
jgi:hypothetical protein